ncbi:MAG: DUF3311 domain-containing protein [Rubripirellula sp.]
MNRKSTLVPVVVVSGILLILHQDYWLWTNKNLVFGFIPMGLFWHLGVSLAAVASWAFVTHYYWPFEKDEVASNLYPDSSRPKHDSQLSEEEDLR